ncbi:MAG: transposase [Wenzhouxiangellaceae bacterium]
MPRYRRHFGRNQTVFLTLVTGNRQNWLREPGQKRQLLDALSKIPDRFPVWNLGYVILDDHLHWLFQADNAGISPLVTALKQRMNFERRDAGLPWRRLWQNRYFDHIIRDEEDFGIHLDYIHYNPVKHGYVRAASEYPWSSFQCWVRRGVYDSDWGVNAVPKVSTLDFE